MTEFYEDLFDSNPKALLDAGRSEDGEVHFEQTGDPLIDKWEAEIAQGLDPDLTEGMPKEVLDKMNRDAVKVKKAKEVVADIGDMDVDFRDPRSLSKFVGKNSKEEEDLLQSRLLGKAANLPGMDPRLLGRK